MLLPVVTDHARERWVERVLNPKHFAHLNGCRRSNCQECWKLTSEAKQIAFTARKGIQDSIIACFKLGQQKITSTAFFQALTKGWGRQEIADMTFVSNNAIILVVSKKNNTITTIMTQDMVDDNIQHRLEPKEMKSAFADWKREAKLKNSGPIRRL